MPKDTLRQKIYRWRVRASVFALVATIVLAKPAWIPIIVGASLCLVGLVIRAWASGHIKKGKELATSGPYRYTRNPLYLGNFILGLSIAISANSIWGVALFLLYFLIFYPPVIKEERERMKRLFPREYEEYKNKVPLFFPGLKSYPGASGSKCRWALYKKNREFRALLGAGIVWAVLIAKLLLFHF